MLIGISVTSVTSKRSCALDDGPSMKESETNGEQARENRFETLVLISQHRVSLGED